MGFWWKLMLFVYVSFDADPSHHPNSLPVAWKKVTLTKFYIFILQYFLLQIHCRNRKESREDAEGKRRDSTMRACVHLFVQSMGESYFARKLRFTNKEAKKSLFNKLARKMWDYPFFRLLQVLDLRARKK